MPFLDDLIGIHDITVNGGSPLPRRSTLNVIGTGVSIADNPNEGRTDLTMPTSVGFETITASVIGSDQNDYSPTGHSSAYVERWSCGGTPRTVTGLDANATQRPMIINYGASTITLAHQSGASAAANRFICPGNTNYSLVAGACVEIVRDTVSSRWRVVS